MKCFNKRSVTTGGFSGVPKATFDKAKNIRGYQKVREDGLRIIDSHAHFFSYKLYQGVLEGKSNEERKRIMCTQDMPDPDPVKLGKRWVEELDKYGIDKIVLISYTNDEKSVASAVRAFPKRLIGYVRLVPPWDAAVKRLRFAVQELGIKGVKLFPTIDFFHVSDETLYPLYDAAERLGTPILIHFGLTGSGTKIPSSADLRYANPIDLQPAARDHPNLKFIIPHFGAGFFRETLLLALQCPNVYIDTSSSNVWMDYMPYQLNLKTAFRKTLLALGPKRIVFGTDSNRFPRGFRNNILEQQLKILHDLKVPLTDIQSIMADNISELLRLEK